MKPKHLFLLLTSILLLTTACSKHKIEEMQQQQALRAQVFLYKISVKLNPYDYESYASLGWLLYLQGNREEALENIQRSLNIYPDNLTANSTLAYIKQMEGESDEAEELYQEILATDSISEMAAYAYLNLGVINYHRGAYNKSIDLYNRVLQIKHHPYHALAVFNKGYCYHDMKDYDKALEMYDLAVEMGYRNVDLYTRRGRVFADMGDHQKAKQMYETAVRFNPDEGILNVNWAYSLYELEEYQKALEKADKALEADPQLASAYDIKGSALQKMEQYDKAEEAFQKASLFALEDANIQYNYAQILYINKRFEEAIMQSEKAIILNPKHQDSFIIKAASLQDSGEYDLALTCFQQVLEIYQNNVEAIAGIADIYAAKEMYAEAIAQYKKAIEIDPNKPNFYISWHQAITDLASSNHVLSEKEAELFVQKARENNKKYQLNHDYEFSIFYEAHLQ